MYQVDIIKSWSGYAYVILNRIKDKKILSETKESFKNKNMSVNQKDITGNIFASYSRSPKHMQQKLELKRELKKKLTIIVRNIESHF